MDLLLSMLPIFGNSLCYQNFSVLEKHLLCRMNGLYAFLLDIELWHDPELSWPSCHLFLHHDFAVTSRGSQGSSWSFRRSLWTTEWKSVSCRMISSCLFCDFAVCLAQCALWYFLLKAEQYEICWLCLNMQYVTKTQLIGWIEEVHLRNLAQPLKC